MSEQSSLGAGQRKEQVPISPGLFVMPSPTSHEGHLVGSKCAACGHVVFPKQQVCPRCQADGMDAVSLSTRGKVKSATVFRHSKRPLGYRGSVPFGMGYVELPEGVTILTRFAHADLKEALKPGTPVELSFGKLAECELLEAEKGKDVVIFEFRPITE